MRSVRDSPAVTSSRENLPVSCVGHSRIDYGDRLRAGIIVPSGNSVAEAEIRAMLPPGVIALVTRLPLKGSSEAELLDMISRLEDAARLLADAQVDIIVFHCTAVSTFAPHLGKSIRDRIVKVSGVRAFATSEAIIAGAAALGASRLSLITPYIEEIHVREIAFLETNGIAVCDGAFLGLRTNTEMVGLSPDSLEQWAIGKRSQDAEAYFLSCTAIRSGGIIENLEHVLGRPVLTSNQVMVWHLLRQSGLTDVVNGYGKLLRA